MTPQGVALVKESWKKVVPIADQAADAFYARLFELDPSLRALFKGDMKAQGRKLMSMLNTAIANLHDLGSILPAVEDLGRRHLGYGVEDAHYDTVGEALLWTLEQGLGDAFTDATRAAWAETYTTVASVMKAAAAELHTEVAAAS